MTKFEFSRKMLRGGSALQALALLGAGLSTSVILAAPASAQDYNQVQATGRVQGTDGQPIAGATVSVTSNEQGFTRTVTTGPDGGFRVAALPQGSYTFTVDAPGFDSFSDNAVTLSQGAAANQFTLAATGAASTADVVVTAGRVAVVDFDRVTTGAVINVGELATRVPVARDITSVTLLAPGTAQGDSDFNLLSNGAGQLPSIAGASVSENLYYINGLNITQFRNGLGGVTVPFDFYQSVEVKNGGISAEFGRTTGGVINATTKSGSNDFHGGVTFNYEPDSLREKVPNTYNFDNDSVFNERKDMIAQLSGPIIKDHLFFYGIYQSRDVQGANGATSSAICSPTTQPTICAPYAPTATIGAGYNRLSSSYNTQRSRSPFYGGKLDAVIVDGQRIEATYFNTSSLLTQNLYGTSSAAVRYNPNTNVPGSYVSTTLYRTGGENYVVRYTGTFTDWLTLSAAYGRNYNRSTTESSTPTVSNILDQRTGSSTLGNPTPNNSFNFDKRTFYRADVDLNFNLFGSHHIRAGYDREDLDESSTTIANGGYQLTYAIDTNGATTGLAAGTPYVTARRFVTGGQFATRDEAYYAQDSWTLFDNRLSLNLGIRNDRFVSRNGNGVPFYQSGDQWGPRLGFSFDPVGDNRTKLYGSFSRYFLPVAVNTNVRLAGSELDYDVYYRLAGTNADSTPIYGAPIVNGPGFEACPGPNPTGAAAIGNACVVRNDGTVAPTDATVAANLKSQSADEYILGVEQRFGSRMKVGAYFTQRKLNDSLEDAALDQAIVPLCIAAGNTAASCRALYNGVGQYALINPGRDVVVNLQVPYPNGGTATPQVTLSAAALGYPQAERIYRSMTFTFDREFDGKWSLSANYTYAKLVGNIEGGVRSDNSQTDAGLTTAFDLPALTYGSYGYLPGDVRHNIKIYGSYQLFNALQLGANLQIQSPRKYGCIGRAPISADASPSAPSGLAGRFYQGGAFYCNLDASGNVIVNPTTAVSNVSPYLASGAANPAFVPSTLRLTPRGSRLKSDWLYNLNLDAAIKIPTDAFDGTLRVSVFNVLNHQSVIDLQENGTTAGGAPLQSYGQPQRYQTPRFVRFQFGVNF